ncbi:hypothetical protein HHL17_15735 [Chitinophaga sp. G-6-1-13]|uniref:Uncharacterized protein n=1 Tax=Chitinophaga fulva TaxID=2728842 RepID=A0A848GMQ3_9BACT|nr:hypothetical protein [Chitinophaga fulva]NML38659.1 hypothetical protein [Chitinophaga fulva]
MLPIPFDDRLDKDVLNHLYGTNAADISAVSHAEAIFSDYVENMDNYLNSLIEAASTGGYPTGKIVSHTLLTKIRSVGLTDLEKPAVEIEYLYRMQEDPIQIIASVEKFRTLEKEYRQIIIDQHICLQEFLSLR